MKRTKKTLALVLAVVLLALPLGTLPALADELPTPGYFASMDDFLAAANALKPGSAIAHKIVTPTGTDGEFDIDLYIAGKNETPKAKGMDIVFVIDVSGSMSSTDIALAKSSFAASVTKLFEGDDDVAVKSRVALVTYNETTKTATFNNGTSWTTKNSWATDKDPVLNSSTLWATANSTATQLGIHAAHNLLHQLALDTPAVEGVPANGQAMIIMTDGGPNRVYTGTENSTALSSGTSGRLMDYTLAPTWGSSGNFSNSTGTGGGTNVQEGATGSVEPTIAQAALAIGSGVTLYSIGYGGMFTPGFTTGSVADTVLRNLGAFYNGPTNGAELDALLGDITITIPIRLNNVQLVDLIGNGFELVGAMGDSLSQALPETSAGLLPEADWDDVPSASETFVAPNLTWQLGTVADGILYKLSFTVKIKSNISDGTYYTNTDIASEFVETGDTTPNYQTGGRNKLTYTIDGESKSQAIPACEKYTLTTPPVIVKIGVDKTVAWGDLDSAIAAGEAKPDNWKNYIARSNSTSETFTYKIVVSRTDDNEFPVQVKFGDVYKGAALDLGKLTDSGGNTVFDVDADDYDLLLFDIETTEHVFYYTVTEGPGTYVNRATISDGKVPQSPNDTDGAPSVEVVLDPSHSEATVVISNSPYIPPTVYSYNVVHNYYTQNSSGARRLDGSVNNGTVTTSSPTINADTVATRVLTYNGAAYDFEAVSHTGTVSLVNGHVTITLNYVRTVIDEEGPPLTDLPDENLPDEDIPIEDTDPPLADIPSTGDNTNNMLYLILMLAFGGALSTAIVISRKSKKNSDK